MCVTVNEECYVCVCWCVYAYHRSQSSGNNLIERLKHGEVNPVYFLHTPGVKCKMRGSYLIFWRPASSLCSEQIEDGTRMNSCIIYLPFQSRGWHLSRAMRLQSWPSIKEWDICHFCCNSGHKYALSLAWVSVLVESVIIGKQNQEKPLEDSLGYITTCAWFIFSTKTWMVSPFNLEWPLGYTTLGIKMKILFQD